MKKFDYQNLKKNEFKKIKNDILKFTTELFLQPDILWLNSALIDAFSANRKSFMAHQLLHLDNLYLLGLFHFEMIESYNLYKIQITMSLAMEVLIRTSIELVTKETASIASLKLV